MADMCIREQWLENYEEKEIFYNKEVHFNDILFKYYDSEAGKRNLIKFEAFVYRW